MTIQYLVWYANTIDIINNSFSKTHINSPYIPQRNNNLNHLACYIISCT